MTQTLSPLQAKIQALIADPKFGLQYAVIQELPAFQSLAEIYRRGKPTKHDLWKVEKINHLGLTLKAFNAKSTAFLPEHQFRQAVEIYTKVEQVKLPRAF